MTATDNENSIAQVARDGGSAPMTPDELKKFQNEIRETTSNGTGSWYDRRGVGEDVRLCYWEGQARDGRKRKAVLREDPIPYEGAPDRRIRAADMIVNEHVVVTALAVMRMLASVRVSSLQTHDPARGARLTTLLRWIIKNQIGRAQLRTVIEQLANYTYGDSPGVGCLGVWWEREGALEEVTLGADEIATLMMQPEEQGGFGLQTEEVKQALTMIEDPALEEEAAQLISQMLEVEAPRARNIVQQLRTEKAAKFPKPYLRVNGVCWQAYRLFDDLWLPGNTPTDAQRARWFLIRESLSEVELRARVNTHGYTQAFVDEVLAKGEGRSIQNLYANREVSGDGSLATKFSGNKNDDPRRFQYEVLTTYYRAVNDDLVPGLYYFPMNLDVDIPGHDRELLNYHLPRRKVYPFVFTQRETLNNNLLDSRGVPETAMTDQDALKLTADSRLGNAMLRAFPPFETPRGRPQLKLKFSPLGAIKVDRPGEISPMEMPDYPNGMTEEQVHIWNQLHRYFGMFAGEDMNPMIAQLWNQWRADKFGDAILEALSMTLALAQQYMSDEDIQAVCDTRTGMPVARDRAAIQGEFGLDLDYNVAGLDLAYIKELAEVVGTMILPADSTSVIQRDKLVMWLMQAINPNMAEEVVVPGDEANAKEGADERNNIAQIASGLQPDMATEGQNWGLRMNEWKKAMESNPNLMDGWTPKNRQVAEARMKHLEKQFEQWNINPTVGKQMGKKV